MTEPRSKITFLCREDFANVSTEIARALRERSTKWDARVVALAPHAFNYPIPHDLDVLGSTPEARRAATEFLTQSTHVVWAEEATNIGDDYSAYGRPDGLGGMLRDTKGKRLFTFHAGVSYRSYSSKYNPLDRQHFDGQLCSPDLLRLANPGARAVWAKPMTVDHGRVDGFWKARRAYGKVVITHSPSSHITKGTAMIRRVMANVQRACPAVEYRELGGPVGQHLSNAELLRQRECAVLHIDQYHTGVGAIAISAYEAFSLGTLSLGSSNQTCRAAYEQWGFSPETHPAIPLVFERMERANEGQTERALSKLITKVARTPFDELEVRGRAAARWVDDHLSAVPFVKSWEAQIDALDAAPAKMHAA